jgi:hypothetical protein
VESVAFLISSVVIGELVPQRFDIDIQEVRPVSQAIMHFGRLLAGPDDVDVCEIPARKSEQVGVGNAINDRRFREENNSQ